MDILKRFVGKGGRLLLIGDPGRRSDINIVADGFGILFQEGYLYNVKEHELNFRNVLVKDFQPDGLTDGLAQIALYTAGSIKSSGVPLAFTDANTYSSMLERVEPFAPIVKTADGSVLAVADLTFLAPPNNTTLDNDQFISNIADFLTTGERVFDLTDFPHFFDGEIDIRLGQAGLFDLGTRIKGMLSAARISSVVRGVEDLTRDTAFLGLYQDARAVEAVSCLRWNSGGRPDSYAIYARYPRRGHRHPAASPRAGEMGAGGARTRQGRPACHCGPPGVGGLHGRTCGGLLGSLSGLLRHSLTPGRCPVNPDPDECLGGEANGAYDMTAALLVVTDISLLTGAR